MSATDLPAFMFYPADWMTDIKVQSLDFEHQGIWFALLCVMHKCEERGKLVENGKPMLRTTIAKLISCDLRKFNRAFDELLAKKIVYTDKDGIAYNKRMVKDEAIRKVRKEAGKQGGNPNLLNQKNKKGSGEGERPSYSSSNSSTITECVQELRKKSVDNEDWLANTHAATETPTQLIINFCNQWITTAQIKYKFQDYEPNKLISFMLEDLQKQHPKPLPAKPAEVGDDWY